MPEYGVFPPELYVEVLNKEEISAIMAYAYKENIPVVCRGAGTGLAGGATCKYGGIMLSVMLHEQDLSDRQKEPDHHSGAGSTSHRYPGGSSGKADFFLMPDRAKNSSILAAMLSQSPMA